VKWLRLLLYLIPALLLGYWLLQRRRRTPLLPDPTLEALAALRRRGADLSRPTTVTFLLSFDSLVAAETAARDLPPSWATRITELADQHRWACKAATTMLPARDELSARAQELEAIAMHHGGEYEGWEVEGSTAR
jgi:Regulator of ribonuclease activity B